MLQERGSFEGFVVISAFGLGTRDPVNGHPHGTKKGSNEDDGAEGVRAWNDFTGLAARQS